MQPAYTNTRVIVITTWVDDDTGDFRARIATPRTGAKASVRTTLLAARQAVVDEVAAWLAESEKGPATA